MVDMKEVVRKAEEFALSEIEKYGIPTKIHFGIANKKGLELAKRLNVNSDIVGLGTRLMDLKIGQAISENKLKDHVRMSSDYAKEFLKTFDLPKEMLEKVLNCIEGHHKDVSWICKEAEVVANADCYRFLTLKGWLVGFHLFSTRKQPFEDALKSAEAKADEKWGILSLGICKGGLEADYKLIKEICQKSKV